MEDTNQMTTKKALTVVGLLVFLIIVTLIIPAKWVGLGSGTSASKRGSALLLKSPSEFASLRRDIDKNSNPDWKDLLNETTSTTTKAAASKVTVTESDKKRLADPNNLTASFSKNMYTVSAYAEKNGEMTKEQQENLVAEMMAAEAKKIVVKEYFLEDIVQAKNDTLETKKIYGNALGALLKRSSTYKLGEGDVEIIKAYTESKDATLLSALVVKKNNVDSLIVSLLKIPVPFSAVPYHLIALNRLSAYKTTLENISQVDIDPIRATISFNGYLTTAQGLYNGLISMNEYFKYSGVTFNQNESGYFLTGGYTK